MGCGAGQDLAMGWKLPALAAVVAVVALTLAGVAVGLVIGGPLGALLGTVPGALAAVTANFIPSLRDRTERRRRLVETWEAVGEPVLETIPENPAGLLRPDRKMVEFTGRKVELAALKSWCASEDRRSVRIIVGAGGVGKTRLALRVAADWEAGGGQWRLITAGHEAEAVTGARGVASG
jgi:hypothetical protein